MVVQFINKTLLLKQKIPYPQCEFSEPVHNMHINGMTNSKKMEYVK